MENNTNRGLQPFEENWTLIEDLIKRTCRLKRLDPDESPEFASYAVVKLIEDDCRRLRSFQGKARLSTYLTVVLQRLLMDYRTEKWGKWRASKAAKELGDAAIRLEELLFREGHSVTEAAQTLRVNDGFVDLSDDEIWALAEQLPSRVRRTFMEPVDPTDLVTPPGRDHFEERLSAVSLRALEAGLANAAKRLTEDDRELLRLRFVKELTVPQIATRLGATSAALYGRIQRLLGRLRTELEDQGLSAEPLDSFDWNRFEIDLQAIFAVEQISRSAAV